MGKIKPETRRKRVEKSLRQQLTSKGADVDLFEDLISDYMRMWDLKEMFFTDLQENGLRPGGKESASPKQIPIVNRQMLALLKQMDITTENVVREDGEDNDAL